MKIIKKYALCAVVFLFLLGLGWDHSTKGLDLTDEGWYVSTPLRYALGDMPFRDEVINTVHSYDILLSLVFRIFPDISLLQIRVLGVIFQLASLGIFFILLIRFIPPYAASLCLGVMFLVNNFSGLSAPSYDSLSSGFLLALITFSVFSFISAYNTTRTLCSIASGIIFILLCISYGPMFLLILIPLSVLAVMAAGKDSQDKKIFIRGSLLFFLTVVMLGVICFLLIFLNGILSDLLANLKLAYSAHAGRFYLPLWKRFLFISKELLSTMPFAGILIISAAVCLFILSKVKGKILNFLAVAVIIFVFFKYYVVYSWMYQITPLKFLSFTFLLFIVTGFLRVFFIRRKGDDNKWGVVRNMMLAWGFAAVGIYLASTDTGIRKAIQGVTPIFCALVADIYRMAGAEKTSWKWSEIHKNPVKILILTILALFFIEGANYYSKTIYHEGGKALTSEFKHPKLKGIYSTPEKVKAIEDILGYMKDKVKRGDYMLCYNYIPMMYFLTDTRAAYPITGSGGYAALLIEKEMTEDMIRRGRIPKYCIRMKVVPATTWDYPMRYMEGQPLDIYVMAKYYLKKSLFPFEVWERKSGDKKGVYPGEKPVFAQLFYKWDADGSIIPAPLIEKTAPPITLLNLKGPFVFQRLRSGGQDILAVIPGQKQFSSKNSVLFGYTWPNKNAVRKIKKGDNIVFKVSARVNNYALGCSASIFIRSNSGSQKNVCSIDSASWKDYSVSMIASMDNEEFLLPIFFSPSSPRETLEIKDVAVFVE